MPSARNVLRVLLLSALVVACGGDDEDNDDDSVTNPFIPPALRLQITPQVDTLFVSDTAVLLDRRQLTVAAFSVNLPIVTPSGVVFSSKTPSIVSVDTIGFVAPVSIGTGTIQARINGIKTTSTVVVLPKVQSIVFDPTTISGVVGDTLLITASALDSRGQLASGTAYTFRASDPASAIVQKFGTRVARVIPQRTGTLTIIATAGGKTASVSGTIR
ncbi:MAG TPA: hypothetical protein VNC18_14300 [Gemmatimonadaceae bacterium]|jgi:hypothetical protein|nr:hypothetical protein [Gemmatimonadaceae bacterium]